MVRVFTRFHSKYGTVQVKKLTYFFRSHTCTVSRSKIRPVPPVPCKRQGGIVQVFVRAKFCPDPCKRGLIILRVFAIFGSSFFESALVIAWLHRLVNRFVIPLRYTSYRFYKVLKRLCNVSTRRLYKLRELCCDSQGCSRGG